MIPDDVIEGYLGSLFGDSEPGQNHHQMLFASADAADHTALGLPQIDKLKVTFFMLAPDGQVDADRFVTDSIRAAIVRARQERTMPYFVGIAMEVHVVHADGTELTENLARRMMADKKLEEHPAAVEVTMLYAACRDGRRWVGTHYLTGTNAGTKVGPDIRSGTIGPEENYLYQRLLRSAVGI